MEGEQFLVLVHDVTKIKEMEAYNKKVKNTYFASVAHELRTPLNSMIPLTESLEAHVTDERGKYFLKVITHSARHLEVVIEDALEMTRLENNTFEVNKCLFDARQSISDIVESMNF